MAEWKKVVVSGSDAALSTLTLGGIEEATALTSPYAVVITGSDGKLFFTSSAAIEGTTLGAGSGILITNEEISFDSASMAGSGLVAGTTPNQGISASVDDVSIEINTTNKLAVKSGSIGTDQIADSLGTLNENEFTGSFTGSFDGTFTGDVTLGPLTNSPQGGIADLNYNGSATTIKVSGSDDLNTNGDNHLTKWTSSGAFLRTQIVEEGNEITFGDSINYTASFSGDINVGGDLTVTGTASFVNVEQLAVEDKYIVLNTGSTNNDAGGIVVQKKNDDNPFVGNLFGFQDSTKRWAITDSLDPQTDGTEDFTAQAFAGLTSASNDSTDPNTINFWPEREGGEANYMLNPGNIYISDNASNPEIWIYTG